SQLMEVWMNLPVFPAHHSLPLSRFGVLTTTFRYVHHICALTSLLVILFTPTLTNATVVLPVSETDMAQQASDIVIGKISKLQSAWDKNHQQIFTKITLTVEEVLKGNLKKHRLNVTQTGGVVDDVESWIDGNPQFTEGEKVLLFLEKQENGSLHVLHLY